MQAATEVRKEVIELVNLTTGKAVDVLLNYETVKLFNNEQLEVDQYDAYLLGFQARNIPITCFKLRQERIPFSKSQNKHSFVAAAKPCLSAAIHLLLQLNVLLFCSAEKAVIAQSFLSCKPLYAFAWPLLFCAI